MLHYIEARMHLLRKEYKKSLREIVKIVALYPRDREWMAPALLFECRNIFVLQVRWRKRSRWLKS